MASHGVARVSHPRTEEQRQADLDKISLYQNLEHQIRQSTTSKDYGGETFKLSARILRLNPEYYTVWNIRRRCLSLELFSKSPPLAEPLLPKGRNNDTSCNPLAPFQETTTTTEPQNIHQKRPCSSETELPPAVPTPEEIQATASTLTNTELTDDAHAQDLQLISSELSFTLPLLIEFPKCYWIWNYRLWILDQAILRLPVRDARGVWEQELNLVGKMLQRDCRNFHAWGYRRHIVTQLESHGLEGQSLAESEFQYTTKAIHADLSNFSAWHNRSQLIPRLLSERKADDLSRQEFLNTELSLVKDGLNVGPEDQSLWFYHQYLMSNILDDPSGNSITPKLTKVERHSYFSRELEDMKDLLVDYNDIKWIYEALVECTNAASRLRGTPLSEDESDEMAKWLLKLMELDPKRSGRWVDLNKLLGL